MLEPIADKPLHATLGKKFSVGLVKPLKSQGIMTAQN